MPCGLGAGLGNEVAGQTALCGHSGYVQLTSRPTLIDCMWTVGESGPAPSPMSCLAQRSCTSRSSRTMNWLLTKLLPRSQPCTGGSHPIPPHRAHPSRAAPGMRLTCLHTARPFPPHVPWGSVTHCACLHGLIPRFLKKQYDLLRFHNCLLLLVRPGSISSVLPLST